MEISDRVGDFKGTLAVLEKNNSNFGFEFQSLPEAFLTKTSVLLLAGISITWKLWITVMFGASWWPLQCKVMLKWVKIMILNDLVVTLTPGPAGVLELRQPLSILWRRESPTRGHENEGSDQTRGNQILKGKGFCFSTFLKRFNIKSPPVGCSQGQEPHLGHKDHRWPASHLAWTSGYQYFHQKLG